LCTNSFRTDRFALPRIDAIHLPHGTMLHLAKGVLVRCALNVGAAVARTRVSAGVGAFTTCCHFRIEIVAENGFDAFESFSTDRGRRATIWGKCVGDLDTEKRLMGPSRPSTKRLTFTSPPIELRSIGPLWTIHQLSGRSRAVLSFVHHTLDIGSAVVPGYSWVFASSLSLAAMFCYIVVVVVAENPIEMLLHGCPLVAQCFVG
jgi:hypothetical protein